MRANSCNIHGRSAVKTRQSDSWYTIRAMITTVGGVFLSFFFLLADAHIAAAQLIDTLSFLAPCTTSEGCQKGSDGDHLLHWWKEPGYDRAYYLKFGSWSHWERYTWDANWIYLHTDQSNPDNPYAWTDPRWMKRFQNVGEKFTVGGDIYWWDTNCNLTVNAFSRTMTLKEYFPSYNWGGAAGIRETIWLKYKWDTGRYEKFYYAKGWGWIRWEYWENGVLTNAATFNNNAANLSGWPIASCP